MSDATQKDVPLILTQPATEKMTAAERNELAYQRALSQLTPGSPAFKALRRSKRSIRVFLQHASYWPTGRATPKANYSKRNDG